MNDNKRTTDDELMKALSEEHIKALSDEYRALSDDEPDFPRSNDWLNNFLKTRDTTEPAPETISINSKRKKSHNFIRINLRFPRVATIILCILLVGSGIGLSTEAIRLRIFNLFTDSSEEFTRITIGVDTDLLKYIQENWLDAYYLAMVPENYVLIDANEINDLKQMTYKLQDHVLFFQQSDNIVSIQLDTEDALAESLLVEGQSAVYTQKGDIQQLFWVGTAGTNFMLITNDNDISKSDLITIAESTRKID